MARTLLFLFRWAVFLAACSYLWRQFVAVESTSAIAWLRSMANVESGTWTSMGVVLALMAVNWGLEAWKWRALVASEERLSSWIALKATLAGTGVSLLTPNRTGEFVGRALFLRPEVRVQGAALTVLGSVAQLSITCLAGCVALWLCTRDPSFAPPGLHGAAIGLTVVAAMSGVVLLAMYLRPALLRRLFDLVPVLRPFDQRFQALDACPPRTLGFVLALSVLRYVVFTLQFLMLLGLFEPQVARPDALIAVPVIFLITTLVPTVMLTELGVRGAAASMVLSGQGGDATGAVLASTMLWLINVLLPAVLGSIVLLLARIRTKSDPA